MKHLLLTTIAAVVLVGCATTQSPEPPTARVLDVPILAAAYNGNIATVKQHLAAGTDVNAADENGWTALHQAAFKGRKEIAELLITKGADVNAKDEDGGTPLDVAIKYKQTETADLLRKHGGISGAADSIHLAAAVGNIEVVKQHLAAGVDVNAKGYRGFTPLHYAARNGHKEIAELLIAKGANVNVKDDAGETPLDLADGETADLLRKHGGKRGEELKAEDK
ncbi:ankyrin repeat domain-containing protein [bacterium]|nr:ankyrin repeat domain-containing protein [bacterium]